LSFIASQDAKLNNAQAPKKRGSSKRSTYKKFVGLKNTESVLTNEINHYLGPMTFCGYGCQAKHFEGESTRNRCCHNGNGQFKKFHPAHTGLLHLLKTEDNLRTHSRVYNSLFQMATLGSSFGGQIFTPKEFPFYFKFSGGIYHSIPPLIPKNNVEPRFVQLYVIDSFEDEVKARIAEGRKLNVNDSLITVISRIIHDVNPFIGTFKTIGTKLKRENLDEVHLKILGYDGEYCSPRPNQLSVFLPDLTDHSVIYDKHRAIRCRNKNGKVSDIYELNGMYDPLHYPLLFPYGDCGYSYFHQREIGGDNHTTCLKFYQQLLQIRKNNILLNFGRLSKEYIADQYAKVEKMRLDYISTHQEECRGDSYTNVVDFVKNRKRQQKNNSNSKLGRQYVVLPATFKGGPRYYNQCFHDGINIVNQIDSPCLIGTMTCNPEWREVKENLEFGEKPFDRIDLLDRVFKMKLNALIEDIFEKHVFGYAIGKIVVVEFQQRGLPHAHILVILDPNDRPVCSEDFDNLFQATIPDKDKEPLLFSLVSEHQVHDCEKGNCIDEDGNCRFHYRFENCDETSLFSSQRVKWKRPNNGNVIKKYCYKKKSSYIMIIEILFHTTLHYY
jgi:hypothetical protein